MGIYNLYALLYIHILYALLYICILFVLLYIFILFPPAHPAVICFYNENILVPNDQFKLDIVLPKITLYKDNMVPRGLRESFD